jgi:hypothetical protein
MYDLSNHLQQALIMNTLDPQQVVPLETLLKYITGRISYQDIKHRVKHAVSRDFIVSGLNVFI